MLYLKIFGETMPENVGKGSGKGLHFIVNGWCLSAQAGWGNYCSQDPTRCKIDLDPNTIRTDCEIAIWNTKDNKMIKLHNDSVMGWISWDLVFDIVEWLRKSKKIPKTQTVRKKIFELERQYNKEEV